MSITAQPDWVFHRGGKPTEADLMQRLVSEFPAFRPRWEKHLQFWNGEPAGPYNDIAEFAHFVVEDIYPAERIEEIQHAFDVMEEFLVAGNQKVQELVVIGFLEDVQNIASCRPFGRAVFIPFLGPKSREAWDEVERMWAGKTSLMDVVETERKARR